MMFGILKKNLVFALVLLAVAGTGSARENQDKLTGRLASALSVDTPNLAVWVHFIDKGVQGADLSDALASRASELTEKTRARRAKSISGRSLVDEADLPLSASYLEAIAGTGAAPRQLSRWLNAASFNATDDQITAISRLPFVDKIDLVAGGKGTRTEPVAAPTAEAAEIIQQARADENLDVYYYGASYPGLLQLNVPAAHASGLSGNGVTIAIFDTGFELSHECFEHLDVVETWDFINGNPFVGNEPHEDPDQTLYGTATLSSLAGYSPNNLIGSAYAASVILAKTENLDSETPAEEDNWIAAMEWAEERGADIVSSGLGYYYWYNFSDLDGQTTLITIAAEMAAARGVLVVNGVGDQRNSEDWPHILPPCDGNNVLAVGSIDLNSQISWFSSPGPTSDGRIKPDVMALGSGTSVALARRPDMYYFGYGTNYAVPLISGAAALILEQNPHLNPTQVMKALRETASRSILPDNDHGWGTIDVLSAIAYWAPTIVHEPLPNVEPGGGSFRVEATITSEVGLDESNLSLAWRRAGQDWHLVPLSLDQGQTYAATLSAQPGGTQVEYYLIAKDINGMTAQDPPMAPRDLHSFEVATDTTGPVISHISLADQTPVTWPAIIEVEATDNLGVADISIQYRLQSGAWEGPFPMNQVGDRWELEFPWPYPAIPGAVFTYLIMARDTAESPNLTIGGPFTFKMVEHKGHVLVVDNRAQTKSDNNGRATGHDSSAEDKSAADLGQWLTDAGFLVDVVLAEEVGPSSFLDYDAVMVSCGGNFSPLGYPALRRSMISWAETGGRILVEGGEVAYAADVSPGYPELKEKVLHILSYQGDDAASLRPPLELRNHPLVSRPHRLPVPFTINNSGGGDYGACDLVEVDDSAFVAMQASYGSLNGGVIVHDNNTGIDAGQIVYLPLNLMKTFPADGQALLDNAMTYLLFNEPPGPSSISGKVTLVGQTDHSGVTVSAGPDLSATTAADGSYSIEGLWGGTYLVTADAQGFAPDTRAIVLPDEVAYPDVNLYLIPVVEVSYPDSPGMSIPDNDPQGIRRTQNVTETGELVGIDIDGDISHFSIGNLMITLASPAGTTVTLHNRTGGTVDDLVGNWPANLFVDGPGELADFLGEDPQGDWTFHVADLQFGASGTLNSWSLNLQVKSSEVAAAPDTPPAVTRLLGNVPNPFNPQTAIAFELAAPGQVAMEVYDVKGRLVRRLARRSYRAGRHTVVWDGRDDQGGQPASGIYFCRLQADNSTQVQKMMLVR